MLPTEDRTTTPTVTEEALAACHTEPIRIPGAIQPHGRLLALNPEDLTVFAASANWPADTSDRAADDLPHDLLKGLPPGEAPIAVGQAHLNNPLDNPSDNPLFDVSAHRTDQHVIVEFEAARPLTGEAPIYALTRTFLPRLEEARSVDELTALAAAEMKRLTGFGRCLIYRFDEAGHGVVLAEQADPGYDTYVGHHFPASDIPEQARALYLLNRFRLIADASYRPVPLIVAARGDASPGRTHASASATDIDLSRAQLRSVSPVHLEYMRNMGTLASMSVSIVIDGRLWGLISCHDHAPRALSAPIRLACEHLGQLLAMQIRSVQATSAVAERLELRKLTLQIVSRLSQSDSTLQRLVAEEALMLRLTRATGAAVVLDDQVWSVGETPPDPQILALGQWIAGMGQEIYESADIARHFGGDATVSQNAAGVLAVSISQVHRHLIMWFRPETVRSIRWAGNPHKAISAADGRIHPRKSFDSWVESIRGQSELWSAAELDAVGELRQALIGIVLRRAEELAAVASELGRVNRELESFSYTVSHDLRAPMRHIAGYVDLVMGLEGTLLSERTRRYLQNVKEAAAFAGQLIDALLDFSRMSRTALKRRKVDTALLLADLCDELTRLEPASNIEWRIDDDIPALYGDPLLMQVAIRNLLANAVKYSRPRDPIRIHVRAVRTAAGQGLEVQDNGVGFQMKYADKLFGVFQRLHQAEQFEGTGIGLASVKRIVERHGGTVWASGLPGEGATFGFAIPADKGVNDA